MIRRIVATEGPLLLEALVRRVSVTGYGYRRTGSRIRKIVLAIAGENVLILSTYGEQVVWPGDRRPEIIDQQIVQFRSPDTDGAQCRSISEIPLIELENLARGLIQQGLDGDLLI